MRLYVASSWRNGYQPDVVRALREVDFEVYDFKHPVAGDNGFHWSEIDGGWQSWDVDTYVKALSHPIAEAGFARDFDAMRWADGCVLVMPCGRSAHLEAGWFVGAGKPLWILKDRGEPELMYKMANGIFKGLGPLLIAIQEFDERRQGR